MARKDLLKGLMPSSTEGQEASASPQKRPMRGAVGAVGQSLASLQARALIEVRPDLIDDAGIPERMEAGADIDSLADSIRDYGQQVPVMLRHSPSTEGRYEVVYGRRRVAALKLLDEPVRAFVREMSDRDLIVAQGQENSARRDLSFIEKARFAKSMEDMGFDRKVICDALSTDKTILSRMLAVIDSVPADLIEAIGPAPAAGRDRWRTLADRVKGRPLPQLLKAAKGDDSDARFSSVLAMLASPRPEAEPLKVDGEQIGRIRRGKSRMSLEISPEFGDWLAENIDRLHRDWKDSRD